MIFSYFQHFLSKNQMVKGMLVVKKGRLTVLQRFPEIVPSQVFKNFWEYICKSSQNVRNVVCQENVLEISAESVKYIGGGVYFLINLTAAMHAKQTLLQILCKGFWHCRVAFCKTSVFV